MFDMGRILVGFVIIRSLLCTCGLSDFDMNATMTKITNIFIRLFLN